MNRKEFLRTSAAFAAGSVLLPSFANMGPRMKPGLQTYSVRNQLNEDFEGTLKQVAEIGYKNIEGYGLGTNGMYLKKFTTSHHAKVVNDLGMNFIATHCSYASHEDAQTMIDAAAEAGLEYLIIPGIPGRLRSTLDGWKAIAENFNKIGELCKNAGLKFGYHNHAFEFEKMEGIIPQELLIESTDPDLVYFEADLFWVTKGGYDPVKLVEKYPGRITLFHVKDADKDLEETTVGKGIIDFEEVFNAAKKGSLEYYFVEDERVDSPFENLKADLEYISGQKFTR